MKKNLLKTFFLTAAMAVGMTAQAQTDVTNYIQNADFSQGTPVTVGICTYAKDMEGNSTEYSQMVPVEGWEFGVENGDARAGGIFTTGSGAWLGGNTYPCPEVNANGGSGNVLGLCGVWTGTAQYVQECTLLAGTYTFSVSVLNTAGTSELAKNLIGFIDENGGEHLGTTKLFPVGEWVTESVTFTLTGSTTGKFSLGVTAQNVGSGSAQHLFLDNLKLTWTDPLSGSKAELEKEIEAAEALLDTEAYTEGVSDLASAIAAATSALASATTAEELGAALQALKEAEKAFLEANMLSKQKYIIQNVNAAFEDAPSFWGVGNSWGTQATLVPHPEYVTLIPMPNGKYWLESQVANKENSWYFTGDFMDQTPAIELTITKVGEPIGYIDDAETIPLYAYTIANGDNYFGWDGENTVLGKNLAADSENALWIIASLDEAKAGLSAATEEDPMDATFLIEDHDFGRNNRNVAFWNVSEDCTNKNLSGGNNVNNCAESYHSVFTISQTIEDAPAGVYELAAQGFYREDAVDGEITTIDYPVFFVNDETASFPVMGELPDHDGNGGNSMGDASVEFADGNYTIEPIRFTIAEGEPIVIGTRLEQSTNLWCIFDNFTLMYYGSGVVDGIETVGSNVSPKSNAIYTLGGQRVNNAQKGIYIINGKKVVK